MNRDECILVDPHDAIVGHGSKYEAHRFTAEAPAGILHRAFSVFLFDSSNRLLLQQRAASKITFPKVWTNTCCSHPLYGYSPTEVDSPEDIASGAVPGAKRAARRKLHHELGIPEDAIPLDNYRFLTRLHYCAADPGPGEATWRWGEHEMDYILVVRADIQTRQNEEEVMATKYVTQEELSAMMAPGSGMVWSPWFRIIAKNFLMTWWNDLDAVIDSGAHADYARIHKIMGP